MVDADLKDGHRQTLTDVNCVPYCLRVCGHASAQSEHITPLPTDNVMCTPLERYKGMRGGSVVSLNAMRP